MLWIPCADVQGSALPVLRGAEECGGRRSIRVAESLQPRQQKRRYLSVRLMSFRLCFTLLLVVGFGCFVVLWCVRYVLLLLILSLVINCSELNVTATVCVFVLFVIHYYALFPIIALAIICLALVLLLEPPKPPPIVISDQDSALEYVSVFETVCCRL
jgi:hypothetical protein